MHSLGTTAKRRTANKGMGALVAYQGVTSWETHCIWIDRAASQWLGGGHAPGPVRVRKSSQTSENSNHCAPAQPPPSVTAHHTTLSTHHDRDTPSVSQLPWLLVWFTPPEAGAAREQGTQLSGDGLSPKAATRAAAGMRLQRLTPPGGRGRSNCTKRRCNAFACVGCVTDLRGAVDGALGRADPGRQELLECLPGARRGRMCV